MSHLIMRAEQGVLGALLAGRDHTLITGTLTRDDFGHPVHQAIYSAVLDLETADYDTERLTTAVAAIVDRTDVDAIWLQQLAATAPDSAHVRAYARIVMQGAFDRDTADFADPYLTAAEITTDTAARETLTRTGQALASQAGTFAQANAIDPDTDPRTLAAPATDTALVMHREDLVIADIVQHPDQAVVVAAWLTSDVFTTEQRRLSFEFGVSMAYDHEPLDAVILAWHVQRARELSSRWGPQPQLPDPHLETDYAYLTRLEITTVTVGIAVIVGHELVSEHTAATLALSGAAAVERDTEAVSEVRTPQRAGLEPPLARPAIDSPRIEL